MLAYNEVWSVVGKCKQQVDIKHRHNIMAEVVQYSTVSYMSVRLDVLSYIYIYVYVYRYIYIYVNILHVGTDWKQNNSQKCPVYLRQECRLK